MNFENLERAWLDVEYTETAEARPAVPEDREEGAIKDEDEPWLLRTEDGIEMLTLAELEERVEFPTDFAEFEIEFPIGDLARAYNYDTHPDRNFEWYGDETVTATAVGKPARMELVSIEFHEPIPQEWLRDLGVEL